MVAVNEAGPGESACKIRVTLDDEIIKCTTVGEGWNELYIYFINFLLNIYFYNIQLIIMQI